MTIKELTLEQIEELVNECKNESLYRAYCQGVLVEGVMLNKAEVWHTAKEIVEKLYKHKDDHLFIWVDELHVFYTKELACFFEHITDRKERMKAAKLLCNKLFYYVAVMLYHEMMQNESVRKELTYQKEEKMLMLQAYAGRGYYFDYSTLNNVFSSLCNCIFWNEPQDVDEFIAQYEEKRKEGMIVYDYSYVQKCPVTEKYEATPEDVEIVANEWWGMNTFNTHECAQKAYRVIQSYLEDETDIYNSYIWVAFYRAFSRCGLFKAEPSQKKHYDSFSVDMNNRFKTRGMCTEDTLSQWTILIRAGQELGDKENKLKAKKNTKSKYKMVWRLARQLEEKIKRLAVPNK